jgi:hypothetical protein
MRGLFLAGMAGVLFASSAAGQPRHPKYPRWISDYEAGRAAAKASGKPMLVVLRCEP